MSKYFLIKHKSAHFYRLVDKDKNRMTRIFVSNDIDLCNIKSFNDLHISNLSFSMRYIEYGNYKLICIFNSFAEVRNIKTTHPELFI